MAGVNGVEIKVGQVWRCRDGQQRKVVGNDGHHAYPWDLGGDVSVDIYGCESGTGDRSDCDLIELVKDEKGFTIWHGVEQPKIDMVPNALAVQVGGSHYKDCAIQPIEYIHANKLGFAEGNVVKYITRHRQKHGADDVKKAIHYCQLLLELEYGAGKTEGGA